MDDHNQRKEQGEKLAARMQADPGDEEAARQLFELYHRPVIQIFRRRGPYGRENALDLTQTTFLRIYTSIESFRRDAGFETWFFTVAMNVYREAIRKLNAEKRSGQEEVGLDDVVDLENGGSFQPRSPDPLPEEIILDEERRLLLRQAVARLPEQMRTCLIYRLYHGMKYREIAAITGLALGTVKAHLNEAKNRVRRDLEAEPEEAR